jgi:hypothetical protein
LEKLWKQTASDLAHVKCREKVIRKTGRLGNVYVPVGEPCSTMTFPVCGTLHSPENHYLHSCPNCHSTSIRDESGRAIEHMACVNASFALGKLNKSGHLNGQAALNVTAFQGPVLLQPPPPPFEKFSNFQ